jgi:hypothetical protein
MQVITLGVATGAQSTHCLHRHESGQQVRQVTNHPCFPQAEFLQKSLLSQAREKAGQLIDWIVGHKCPCMAR